MGVTSRLEVKMDQTQFEDGEADGSKVYPVGFEPLRIPKLRTLTMIIIDLFIVLGLVVLIALGLLGGGEYPPTTKHFLACLNFSNPRAYLSVIGTFLIVWATWLMGIMWDHDLTPGWTCSCNIGGCCALLDYVPLILAFLVFAFAHAVDPLFSVEEHSGVQTGLFEYLDTGDSKKKISPRAIVAFVASIFALVTWLVASSFLTTRKRELMRSAQLAYIIFILIVSLMVGVNANVESVKAWRMASALIGAALVGLGEISQNRKRRRGLIWMKSNQPNPTPDMFYWGGLFSLSVGWMTIGFATGAYEMTTLDRVKYLTTSFPFDGTMDSQFCVDVEQEKLYFSIVGAVGIAFATCFVDGRWDRGTTLTFPGSLGTELMTVVLAWILFGASFGFNSGTHGWGHSNNTRGWVCGGLSIAGFLLQLTKHRATEVRSFRYYVFSCACFSGVTLALGVLSGLSGDLSTVDNIAIALGVIGAFMAVLGMYLIESRRRRGLAWIRGITDPLPQLDYYSRGAVLYGVGWLVIGFANAGNLK
eukprot:c11686_g1_i2.p1 GENE.c11686_g1_i2~~c11686_g1_i2.p1  ORF type:complete len:531 (+),score=65.16 c11686_g1_i2:1-1593(+)